MFYKVADRIKTLRESYKLSQSELGRKIGVKRGTVNAWEMGINIPSLQKLYSLSNFFHTTIDSLLGFDDRHVVDISPLTPEQKEIVIKLIKNFEQ